MSTDKIKQPLPTILGWTVIKGRREMNRFEKENYISYCAAGANFPCMARAEISSDENCKTQTLELHELEAMLGALRALAVKKSTATI